jgi:CheY-like chemotaxis protein
MEHCMSHFKTIMLADDELDIRTVCRILLESSEIHILEASNGTDALELARQSPPDLIVLDWMMPGLDGLEVLQALRREPETAAIPIIMLSSRDQPEDIQRALDLDVTAYLSKPFNPVELLATVERAL